MALPVKDQMKYWGISAAVLMISLWYLGDVILPFVLGGAVAYFLDPIADRFEAMGTSRATATAIIAVVAILIFAIMALAVIPTLIFQAIGLFETAPQLFSEFQAFLGKNFPSLMDENSVMRKSLLQLGELIQEQGPALVNTIVSSAAGLINVVLLLVIVPVVAVYLLYDWDRMIAHIDELLPRDHAPVVRKLARDIDMTLSSFVRGMGTVSLILGTYYAIALMLVGLNFGLVVGFVAGLVTFIPYVGALIGGALAIGLGLFQFWGDWVSLGLVAGIFVLGQVIEGNILTPKLVGSSVGLHPVWLIFALSVFGALFGFVGMLVAVPLAAVLGVLARFFTAQYREGRLFKGVAGREDTPEESQ
ncbi:MAG: AI-2E family transporter [Rhodobacterales bacterium]|nr:MAG: AI-2E family transporter [Rhodobacterales bacterium]